MNEVNSKISKERLILFQQTAEKIKYNYKKSLINKKSKVLFENKIKNSNEFFGRDEFSNPVITKSDYNLKGKLEEVKIVSCNQNTLFGEIEKNIKKKEHAA